MRRRTLRVMRRMQMKHDEADIERDEEAGET
jgi:hypothetical protein